MRFRSRGLPVNLYDVWVPNLAPSEGLLRAARSCSRGEFGRRCEAGSIDRRNHNIKNHGQKFTLRLLQKLGRKRNITLMCHCDEDQKHCHRRLLKKILSAKIS